MAFFTCLGALSLRPDVAPVCPGALALFPGAGVVAVVVVWPGAVPLLPGAVALLPRGAVGAGAGGGLGAAVVVGVTMGVARPRGFLGVATRVVVTEGGAVRRRLGALLLSCEALLRAAGA